MQKVIIIFGLVMVVGVCLQLIAYARQKKPQSINRIVSDEDARRYAGMHVMTNGFGGTVVASGETFEVMIAEAAALDNEVRDRLVYVCLPKKGEWMLGGRYIGSADTK